MKRCLRVCMCLTLILGVREARAAILLEDNFDSDLTGAPPAGWTDSYFGWAGEPYTAQQAAALGVSIRVDDQVHYGPSGKSLRFFDTSVRGSASPVGSQVSRTFTPAQSVALEYYIRSSKTGTGSDSNYESTFVGVKGDATNSNSWYSLGFGSANGGGQAGYIGVIDAIRGVWADRQLLPYQKDTWYYVRNTIDIPTKTIDFYVQQADTPSINATFTRHDSQYANTHVDELMFFTSNSQGADAYIDEVSLRVLDIELPNTSIAKNIFRVVLPVVELVSLVKKGIGDPYMWFGGTFIERQLGEVGSAVVKSILGPAFIALPDPEPASKALSLVVGWSFVFDQVVYIIEHGLARLIENDPPDSDYTKVAIPSPPQVRLEGLDALPLDEAAIIRRSVQFKAEFAATMQAMLTSMERAAGAREAGDGTWAKIQDDLVGEYLRSLADLGAEIDAAETETASLIGGWGIPNLALTAAEVEAAQSSWLSDGLPPQEASLLSLFGMSEADLQQEIGALAAIDPSALAWISDVPVSQLYTGARRYDLYNQAISSIPEPSTFIVWALLGAISISVGWWRRRRAA